jgi:hypothetical protein
MTAIRIVNKDWGKQAPLERALRRLNAVMFAVVPSSSIVVPNRQVRM